ncbi:hypothetical protein V2J09_002185 [Rumex salicifolius]
MAKEGAELVRFELELEEGMSWLPAHVLHDACGFHDYCFSKDKLAQRAPLNKHNNNHHHHLKLIGEPLHRPHVGSSPRRSKPTLRPRYTNNRASGGPGMQAIFLDSGQKSSGGTGVFLPRRAGSDFQPKQKPACSPVLLPSRVVHALNLNVHALGLQISCQRDEKTKLKSRPDENPWENNKKEKTNGNSTNKDEPKSADANSQTEQNHSSPEIFLPKEWIY